MSLSDLRESPAFKQFLKFFMVGFCAFSIDAIVLQSLVSLADWNPYIARIPSATAAIAFSWIVNRLYTFRASTSAKITRSIVSHVAATLISLAVNLAVYWAFLTAFPALTAYPVIALTAGSAVGLMLNFVLAKYWVFK